MHAHTHAHVHIHASARVYSPAALPSLQQGQAAAFDALACTKINQRIQCARLAFFLLLGRAHGAGGDLSWFFCEGVGHIRRKRMRLIDNVTWDRTMQHLSAPYFTILERSAAWLMLEYLMRHAYA